MNGSSSRGFAVVLVRFSLTARGQDNSSFVSRTYSQISCTHPEELSLGAGALRRERRDAKVVLDPSTSHFGPFRRRHHFDGQWRNGKASESNVVESTAERSSGTGAAPGRKSS
jgi:hypothetical protein